MSTSHWNRDEVIRRVRDLTEFPQMRKISADPISLYSDSPSPEDFEWSLAVDKAVRNDPDELASILLILSAVKPFWYHVFLDFCGEQCYRYGYQGKWRFLHNLCKSQLIRLQLSLVMEYRSPNEFFGNMFNKMEKFARNPSVRFIKQTKPKPKKPQWKRGHNDKGSMKSPHEKHSAWVSSGPNPKRPDYRSSYKRKQAILNYLYD